MRDIIELLESKSTLPEVEILKLTYSNTDLNPVFSKNTMDYHYGKLAHGYADKYNKKEGNMDFNYAGAFLHNMYFPQFRKPKDNNKPNGPILTLINRKYGSWEDFKDKFEEEAMKIQGSGWVYLSTDGSIKTIVNHEVRDDILILVDWWEHAWALDYQSDKRTYLKNIWKIFNWTVINVRWGKSL